MYEPSRQVSEFHIAGFKFYDGALVLEKLKPGMKLKMVADPTNPHDPYAVELHYKKKKLGFVPGGECGLFSLADFYGHKGVFEARVLQVDPEADPWKQVRVGIYITDKR